MHGHKQATENRRQGTGDRRTLPGSAQFWRGARKKKNRPLRDGFFMSQANELTYASDYAERRRRAKATKPTRPMPTNAIVDGSGTAVKVKPAEATSGSAEP